MDDVQCDPPARSLQVPPVLADRLAFLLKRAQALLAAAHAPGLLAHDLDGRQLAVLLMVVSIGRSSQHRLAQSLEIDRTTMVALIDALEEKGLVERHRDAQDRRAYNIAPTDAGRRSLRKVTDTLAEAEEIFLSPLSAAEVDSLKGSLLKLIERSPALDS
jgi:DNA-binding MarR family transcriptional regulator